MNSKELEQIISEVVNDSEKYTQYYISKYGVSQSSLSQMRSGKRDYKNMRFPTILKLLDAYNGKLKKN